MTEIAWIKGQNNLQCITTYAFICVTASIGIDALNVV